MSNWRNVPVDEARSVIRRNQARPGRPHHGDAGVREVSQDDNANRGRALDGLCGGCTNLLPEVKGEGKYAQVRLQCRANLSPLDLYRKTDLGQAADCPQYKER